MKYILPLAAKCSKSSVSISLLNLETNFHIFVLSIITKNSYFWCEVTTLRLKRGWQNLYITPWLKGVISCCLNPKIKTIRSTRNNAIRTMSFALFSFILHLHHLTWYLTFTCILIVLQILYQFLNLFLLYLFLYVHSLFLLVVHLLFLFCFGFYIHCFIVHVCVLYHWRVSNDFNKDVYIILFLCSCNANTYRQNRNRNFNFPDIEASGLIMGMVHFTWRTR